MTRGPIALAALAASLVVVPAALPKSSTLARGRITGSGTTWKLTVENDSQDLHSIHCVRYFAADGVTITGVQTPTGWASTGSSSTSFGFRQDNPGITVGGTLEIDFTTQASFTAGSVLHYSADCIEDLSTLVPPPVTVSPPPPPPPPPLPPPSAKPCKCLGLNVKLDPTLLNKKLRPDKHDFGVGITWTLKCTKGKGGCAGTLHFSPPKVLAGSMPESNHGLKLNLKRVTIVCAAKCGKKKTGRFEIKMLSRDQLNKLFGRTLAYTVVTKCSNTIRKIPVKVFVDNTGRLKPAP